MNGGRTHPLTGKRALITRNEFLDQDTSVTIVCVADDVESLLLQLDRELDVGIHSYHYAVARPRSGAAARGAHAGNALPCSITWVPDKIFRLECPFDLSWWRGGAAVITDLVISDRIHP